VGKKGKSKDCTWSRVWAKGSRETVWRMLGRGLKRDGYGSWGKERLSRTLGNTGWGGTRKIRLMKVHTEDEKSKQVS